MTYGKLLQALPFAALLLCTTRGAAATLTTYSQPSTGYTSGSTLFNITGADLTMQATLSNAITMVSFSTPGTALTVPDTFATWGAPPDIENGTPRVLFVGASSLTLTFSIPVGLFGFEAASDSFDQQTITARFFNGATLVNTISRDVNNVLGTPGAQLFALRTDEAFTRVVVGTTDPGGIALGTVRAAAVVPEPASLLLTGLGLLGAVLATRLRSARR